MRLRVGPARRSPTRRACCARLHGKGLKVCVWINPYIAQRSPLFDEGRRAATWCKRADGDVWQMDLWQAGHGARRLHQPGRARLVPGKLRALVDRASTAFKTDFGERIPTDVVWHDGSDPERMHNHYTHLYNQAVFDVLEAERGEGEAVLFARSATAGGQQFPVHWGGDSASTFASMAETLRGGLSLAPSRLRLLEPRHRRLRGHARRRGLFKRWVAFGLLSSHSRLHGHYSVRVPWPFDEEAVDVLRLFTTLKRHSCRTCSTPRAKRTSTAGP